MRIENIIMRCITLHLDPIRFHHLQSKMYTDLSILQEKLIDPKFILTKLQKDGYNTFALDFEFKDKDEAIFKPNTLDSPTIQGLTVYKRATCILENTASLHPLNQQPVPYDILAVKPLNEKLFHTLCVDYDMYDVITFDCGVKMPFMLKRNPVYEAIRKGKYFEICYDCMFDEDKRVVCMTNMINIFKATNGKNLIISSHCSDQSTHRTPFDVAALMISLGMTKNVALACMKQNMNEVIRSAQHRKFLKGAIQQTPIQIGLKLGKRIQKHRLKLKEIQRKNQEKNEGKMEE